MNDILTPEEIQEITGAKRAAEQKRVLAKSRIFYIERMDGSLAVTWHHVHHPMITPPTPGPDSNINWAAL